MLVYECGNVIMAATNNTKTVGALAHYLVVAFRKYHKLRGGLENSELGYALFL